MPLGEGIEWAVHCVAVLAVLPEGAALPAARLAEFHGIPAPYLAKHLQSLSRAGIVESVPGRNGGYRLARPAVEITMLDVVDAVADASPSFRCTEIRQRGPAAAPRSHYRTPCTIAVAMRAAEAAWRAELARWTVLDIILDVARHASPVSIRKTVSWMEEVLP